VPARRGGPRLDPIVALRHDESRQRERLTQMRVDGRYAAQVPRFRMCQQPQVGLARLDDIG
jgi:hypothetical protein